jgi:hypothetical protein
MAYTVERLTNEPIVVLTVRDPLGPPEMQREAQMKVAEAGADITGAIYRITDLTELTISFGDIVRSLGEEAKSKREGSMSDSHVRSIIVAKDEIIKMAAASLSQEQYGALNIKLFTTRDEAVAYAREQIAEETAAKSSA